MSTTNLDLLIVEDEHTTRYLLSQIFTLRGFTVRSAEDGFAALEMIRSSAPDILLSDLNMPGMSGFELLSVVRRLYPEIHVIATSGAYSGTQVPRGIAADGFHEKASGMATLLGLLDLATILGTAAFYAHRTPTPLWIDLESRRLSESQHVLLNCPACLRPFRQTIDEVDAEIRETKCRFCDTKVDYAIAFAIQPPSAAIEARSPSEHKPAENESRPSTSQYPSRSPGGLRA